MSSFVLVMLVGLTSGWTDDARVAQQPPVPAGTWKGLLQGAGLNVVFHITATADGKFTATMDSPDQNVTGIPVSQVMYADSVLKIVVAAIQGEFEGKLGADGKFTGQWRQGAAALPLVLEKVPPPAKQPEAESAMATGLGSRAGEARPLAGRSHYATRGSP